MTDQSMMRENRAAARSSINDVDGFDDHYTSTKTIVGQLSITDPAPRMINLMRARLSEHFGRDWRAARAQAEDICYRILFLKIHAAFGPAGFPQCLKDEIRCVRQTLERLAILSGEPNPKLLVHKNLRSLISTLRA